MSWRAAGRKDLGVVLDYLLRDEALCVPLTSRLRVGRRGCSLYFDTDATGSVSDCILFSSTGLLLPMLSRTDGAQEGLSAVLRDLRETVHSIMGVGRSVKAIEELLPLPPTTRIEYFLMTLPRECLRPALPSPQTEGVRVRKADIHDDEELFPLQKGYELEEVVINPSHFNDGQSMKLLRQSLREEIVYEAERSGVPVGKAATNARGFGVDQIGGVYTTPRERGKGIGGLVVTALLREVFAEKKAACLFVKKRNFPAIALYERLGFSLVTDYVISYYGL
jgi:predicted GNAT family acetyltransferase